MKIVVLNLLFIEGKTMRKNRKINVDKIIVTLLYVLAIEVGALVTVIGFDAIISEYMESPTLTKKMTTIPKEILVSKSNLSSDFLKNKIQTFENSLIKISPASSNDVVEINTQSVQPIVYTKSIKLASLSINLKKKRFIDMMIPSILIAKYRIENDRKRVKELLSHKKLSAKDSLWLKKKKYIFKASSYYDLYEKMEVHPTSIVIAQAIIESGWGTSRFFEEANNVFGIWSFNKNEERMVASQKRGDKSIFVKKYPSVEQSIFDYFLVLSTKDAYKEFREKRLESQDPFTLIEHLGKYSELGQEYIDNLKNTIEKNRLLVYDSYHLDI